MKAILTTSSGDRVLPLSSIKSVSAISQSNILVTKQTGKQLQGITLKFE